MQLQILLYILVQMLFWMSEEVHNPVKMNSQVEMFQSQSLKRQVHLLQPQKNGIGNMEMKCVIYIERGEVWK